MKKKVLIALGTIFCLAFSACGKEEAPVAEEPIVVEQKTSAQEPAEAEPAEEETCPYLYEIIEEREVKNGMIQSYLTGEWIEEEKGNRRPIAVSIPNQHSCFPQYGITNAGIIYEVPLRDNMTRLFCLFEDFDDLDRIGPVRSIRDYMVYTGLEHQAIICHWGTAYYANDLLNSDAVDNISQGTAGIAVPTTIAYDRFNRGGNYNTTDSAYLFVDGLKKGVEQRGYSWDLKENFTPKFLFAKDGVTADYKDAEKATKIWPGKEGNYSTVSAYFEYDPISGLYDVYEYGEKLFDEHSGETLQVANVILQVVYAEERDEHGYLILEMHGPQTGDGDMYFFTQGKVVKGKWGRWDGDDQPAHYYDEDGNEIVLNQGKTFVCHIWDKWADSIAYE